MRVTQLFTRWFRQAPTDSQCQVKQALSEPFGGDQVVRVAASSAERLLITPKMLKELVPIRNLPDEELNAFAAGRLARAEAAGSVLFRAGDSAGYVYYLLAGSARVEVGSVQYEVHGGTVNARFPLCATKHRYTATASALTDAQILCVPRRIMSDGSTLGTSRTIEDIIGDSGQVPDTIRHSRLFTEFCKQFPGEEACFPTFPNIALRVNDAIQRGSGTKDVAHIIQMDPAVAAKIVSVANSPLYFSVNRIETCQDAVIRLGVFAVRNLVTAISLRTLFRSQTPHIARMLQGKWEQSVFCSTLCHVLASSNTTKDPEQALLAGLISDIGALPFLYFADRFPCEHAPPHEVETILPYVCGPVGVFLLEKWGLPPELVNIPLTSESWYHDDCEILTLDDIVILAKLHTYIGKPRWAELPPISSIPAYSKIADGRMTPAHSLQILHEARDRIRDAIQSING